MTFDLGCPVPVCRYQGRRSLLRWACCTAPKILAQAGWRRPRGACRRGDQRAPAEHPSRRARLVVGAAELAGRLQRGGRRDAANLWHARRRDRARHQARCAEGQYRHRLPSRDGRSDPEGGAGQQEGPAQAPEARDGRAESFCRDWFEQSGTAGNASRIKITPLAEMANFYRSGKLDPRIETHAAVAQ